MYQIKGSRLQKNETQQVSGDRMAVAWLLGIVAGWTLDARTRTDFKCGVRIGLDDSLGDLDVRCPLPGCPSFRLQVEESVAIWASRARVPAEVVETSDANLVFQAGNIENASRLATYRFVNGVSVVTLSTRKCWFPRSASCDYHVSGAQLIAVHIASLVLVVGGLVLRRSLVGYAALTILLTWSMYGLMLGLYVCEGCYSLRHTLLHEVGHSFGLMHPGERGPIVVFGCGCALSNNSCPEGRKAIMDAKTSGKDPDDCLSEDDRNAADYRSGQPCTNERDCDEPKWTVWWKHGIVLGTPAFLTTAVSLYPWTTPRARVHVARIVSVRPPVAVKKKMNPGDVRRPDRL